MGTATGDDAAIYRIDSDLALVQTVDFFPPIVDDPFQFGEVAAANALSDVYAMGGKPLIALNIVGFPVDLPKNVLGEVLKGGASKAGEAGVLIVGGHTVDDEEPMYGLAVTGVIKPGQQVTNAGSRVGDMLVLTKPIGTGVITTAGKQERVPEDVLDGAVRTMSILNRDASEAMIEVGVNACTDITGFGLLGHLLSMVQAADLAARVTYSSVPLLEGAWELLENGIAPGGTHRNLRSVDPHTDWDPAIGEVAQLMLCDAQTSGGLLISVPRDRLDALLAELRARDVATAAIVGEIVEKASLDGKSIQVLP